MDDVKNFSTVDPNYKFVVFTLINIVVAFLYIIFACYLLLKIKTMFGFRDLPMLLSIMSITLALSSMIIFLSISVAEQF
jgi:hypothetical protein